MQVREIIYRVDYYQEFSIFQIPTCLKWELEPALLNGVCCDNHYNRTIPSKFAFSKCNLHQNNHKNRYFLANLIYWISQHLPCSSIGIVTKYFQEISTKYMNVSPLLTSSPKTAPSLVLPPSSCFYHPSFPPNFQYEP